MEKQAIGATEVKAGSSEKPRENLFISLIFNVILPVLILNKLNAYLGPYYTIIVAILFPLCYASYDFAKRRLFNPIAALGLVSVLIKGGFALFKVDGFWFAIQEAALPTFLGLFTIVSVWLKRPLVNYFIYNENIFNLVLLEKTLDEKNVREQFHRLIWQVTLVFGTAFFVSGILNYVLAINIIVSPAGTDAFNKEFAEMTWKSYIVILIPTMLLNMFGLWWFISRLKKMTGLDVNQIMKSDG